MLFFAARRTGRNKYTHTKLGFSLVRTIIVFAQLLHWKKQNKNLPFFISFSECIWEKDKSWRHSGNKSCTVWTECWLNQSIRKGFRCTIKQKKKKNNKRRLRFLNRKSSRAEKKKDKLMSETLRPPARSSRNEWLKLALKKKKKSENNRRLDEIQFRPQAEQCRSN